MTSDTGMVALKGSLPVEVLMKSAPAIMHTSDAWYTILSVGSSPVAKIVFMCAGPHASRNASTSSYMARQSCFSARSREMTMSISRAPSATHCRISASLCSVLICPDGKPVATEATGMPVPSSARTASGTRAGYTHTAPQWILPTRASQSAPSSISRTSRRTGFRALAHMRCTLPVVSSPDSVVRSMHVTARSSHAAWWSFFTERRGPISAARRSTAFLLTRTLLIQPPSSSMPGLSSGAWCACGPAAAAAAALPAATFADVSTGAMYGADHSAASAYATVSTSSSPSLATASSSSASDAESAAAADAKRRGSDAGAQRRATGARRVCAALAVARGALRAAAAANSGLAARRNAMAAAGGTSRDRRHPTTRAIDRAAAPRRGGERSTALTRWTRADGRRGTSDCGARAGGMQGASSAARRGDDAGNAADAQPALSPSSRVFAPS
mmetsp:Transcript_18067/g.63936  ORF Transcript_18067/g.63936 Transcript_18067/m.63936 type:complete len:444 (-) Transcript_18067:75-1406(-)